MATTTDCDNHAATFTAYPITIHGPYVTVATVPLTRCCTCGWTWTPTEPEEPARERP